VAEAGHEEVGEVAGGAAGVGQLPVNDHHPNPTPRLTLEQQVVEVEVAVLEEKQSTVCSAAYFNHNQIPGYYKKKFIV
jgi:hypothetical protein